MKKELILIFCLIFITGFAAAIAENATTSINEFCGSSTNAPCSGNSDCKAGGCSGQVCGSVNDSAMTTCEYTECYNAGSYGLTCGCSENKCQWVTANVILKCNSDMDCMELVCPNGGFAHEKCVNGMCVTPPLSACPNITKCAKEGEQFSKVYSDEYPENCCAGLTGWNSGMDTRKVVNGTCVQTNLVSGSPVGTCINCGNGVCEKIENVCNCQKDCENTTIQCPIYAVDAAGCPKGTIYMEEIDENGCPKPICKSNTTIYKCPSYALPLCEHELTGVNDQNGCPMFICKKRIGTSIQNQLECPENCKCSGSTTKCTINGQREMTINAGKSGNIIVQIKGENMSTNVTLYKSNEKIYGVFKNNETKEVKMMPDQVVEKVKKKLQQGGEEYNITLDEDGMYQVQTKKKAKLFYLFPVREKTQLELSSESGEIIRIRNPWWGFLAKDTKEQPLAGSSCGTVTPGYNDECCQNKGYDYWNATSEECEFNSE